MRATLPIPLKAPWIRLQTISHRPLSKTITVFLITKLSRRWSSFPRTCSHNSTKRQCSKLPSSTRWATSKPQEASMIRIYQSKNKSLMGMPSSRRALSFWRKTTWIIKLTWVIWTSLNTKCPLKERTRSPIQSSSTAWSRLSTLWTNPLKQQTPSNSDKDTLRTK